MAVDGLDGSTHSPPELTLTTTITTTVPSQHALVTKQNKTKQKPQICDLFCRVQPETRAVDLHGLSLTATTQGFLQRNEALARYMALALQQVRA